MFSDCYFDFDGTLCDTETDIRQAWKATLGELGKPLDAFDRIYTTGPTLDEVVRALYPDEADDALIAAVRAGFVRHYDASGFPNTRPYPGVADGLSRLVAAGKRLFIVTNKRFRATNLIIDRLGWRALFVDIYSSDRFAATPIGKLRKPELLAKALSDHGGDCTRSAMIGDTQLDVEAGSANGLFTIGCTWGYGADLTGANSTVGSFAELMAKI